jgi:hypothetical protein
VGPGLRLGHPASVYIYCFRLWTAVRIAQLQCMHARTAATVLDMFDSIASAVVAATPTTSCSCCSA